MEKSKTQIWNFLQQKKNLAFILTEIVILFDPI